MYSLLIGAALGNAIEFLSLTLYSSLGASIAGAFFPNAEAVAVVSIGIFCISYIARPVGAWVLGRWGDLYGRNFLLNFTIWGVGLANIGVALLPSYKTWGWASVFFLIFFRMIQGFSVGAEYSGAFVYVLEKVKVEQKGLAGGVMGASCFIGMSLGMAFSYALPFLPESGWRYGFAGAGVLSICAFLMRRKNTESPEFSRRAERQKTPALSFKKLGQVFVLACCDGLGTYVLCGFSYVFALFFLNISESLTIKLSLLGVCVAALTSIFVGSRSQKKTPLFLLKRGLYCGAFLYPLIFWLITLHNELWMQILFFLALACMAGWLVGVQPMLGYRLVPANQRLTLLSLGYNTGMAVFGGIMPFAMTLVLKFKANLLVPGLFLGVSCLLLSYIVHRAVLDKEFC